MINKHCFSSCVRWETSQMFSKLHFSAKCTHAHWHLKTNSRAQCSAIAVQLLRAIRDHEKPYRESKTHPCSDSPLATGHPHDEVHGARHCRWWCGMLWELIQSYRIANGHLRTVNMRFLQDIMHDVALFNVHKLRLNSNSSDGGTIWFWLTESFFQRTGIIQNKNGRSIIHPIRYRLDKMKAVYPIYSQLTCRKT